MSSPHVKVWQSALNKRGAGVAEDGIFGPRTLNAGLSLLDDQVIRPERPQNGPESIVAPDGSLDPRSTRNLSSIDSTAFPTLFKLTLIARRVAEAHGLTAKVISGHRTWDEQDTLYAQGRTTGGPRVTNARGGYSNHNFGIAIDFGLFGPDGIYVDGTEPGLAARVYKDVWEEADAEGLPVEWGGNWERFKDTPHFEYRTGLSMQTKRELWERFGSVLPDDS